MIVFVNEIGNEVADSSVNSAFGYIEQKDKNYNIKLEVTRVAGNRTNSEETLKNCELC